MTDLIPIRRELLERIDESAICDGTDATISDDLFTQLVAALDAPVQGEAVAWARQCDLDESDPAIFVAREEVQESGYLVPLYTTPPQPAEDYPACDYCGCIPDHHPWHGSGFINGAESPHIHACNDCRHLLPKSPQPAEVGELVEALRAADEYLSNNKLNEIGSGSILHRQMQDALAKLDGKA